MVTILVLVLILAIIAVVTAFIVGIASGVHGQAIVLAKKIDEADISEELKVYLLIVLIEGSKKKVENGRVLRGTWL